MVDYIESLQSESLEGDSEDQSWIFSYADMMTLLLCFFILLFSISTLDQKQFDEMTKNVSESFKADESKVSQNDGLTPEERQIRALQLMVAMLNMGDNMDEAVKKIEEAAKSRDATEVAGELVGEGMSKKDLKDLIGDIKGGRGKVDDYLEIIMPTKSLFRSGSHELRSSAKAGLSDLATSLSTVDDLLEVEVVGHTDSTKPGASSLYKDNFILSSARAGAVASYLVYNGVPRNKIRVRGMGDLDPIVNEFDSKGRLLPDAMKKNRRVEIILRRKLAYNSDELIRPYKVPPKRRNK